MSRNRGNFRKSRKILTVMHMAGVLEEDLGVSSGQAIRCENVAVSLHFRGKSPNSRGFLRVFLKKSRKSLNLRWINEILFGFPSKLAELGSTFSRCVTPVESFCSFSAVSVANQGKYGNFFEFLAKIRKLLSFCRFLRGKSYGRMYGDIGFKEKTVKVLTLLSIWQGKFAN